MNETGRADDNNYIISESNTDENPFGRGMLKHFLLEAGYVNLNHGSFGATPKMVMEAQDIYKLRMEANPDRWFRSEYKQLVHQVREKVANYVGAEQEDVVLLENASYGVNSLLRNFIFKEGESIVYFSTAYNMVKYTIAYLAETRGVKSFCINISSPLNISEQVRNGLSQLAGQAIKVAVFSHITSVPAIILPIKELATIFKEKGIQVLIDGAHAVGQIPLNIPSYGVDYYISNGHKWLFSPKGTAFLWVAKERQSEVAPAVISSTGAHDFIGEFEYTGTRDYTGYCALLAAFEFRDRFGDEKIMSYNHQLALRVGKYLANRWKTEVLAPADMIGSMVDVLLPTTNETIAMSLTAKIFSEHNLYLVVHQFSGKFWTRLSTQIYNEISDYYDIAEIVAKLCQN